eukprot:CAMPEP_0169447008 /NCGR_PEP_ID=MMETSP1042-20121227/11289_1 /TAXON_ID=464988 /ORGANISM="Hemiselmis andersenii, Strain CCMP1180" /LENGTH=478 /DNA_ID=CAMNT_0009558533 /DNA_START=20 /DNA_END=1456 /DNA_ORIENTATION=+
MARVPLLGLVLGLSLCLCRGERRTQALQGGYHNDAGRFFHPTESSTFQLVKLGNVNVTFLDKTNLLGYDGQDFAQLGKYRVETRMGMITSCNSANFNDVDGILGFGWANQNRSAAILKTLTQRGRPHWDIEQPDSFHEMPRKFAFTATEDLGELQLGGYDPTSIAEPMQLFPMAGFAYGVNITSIKFGDTELLDFAPGHDAYVGEFDSGTTCVLLPNSTVNGSFAKSPFQTLYDRQLLGESFPLVFTIGGRTYDVAFKECVEPASNALILGDPWFRKWIVMHDLTDVNNKKMGLALRSPSYQLGVETDTQPELRAFAQFSPLSKLRANRKVRPMSLTMTGEHGNGGVDKVALQSQSRVTYNVRLSVGTPPQPMQVIFDTGSFMLAVFARPAPTGMTPILAAESGSDAAGASWRDAAKELMWRVQGGVGSSGLIGINALLLVTLGVAALTVARKRREQGVSKRGYQELDTIDEGDELPL